MTDYQLLLAQEKEFIAEEPFYVPLLSNLSALIFAHFENINWAGFYLMRGGRLVLGPFQGKTACIHIPVGRGVCGTAAAQDAVQRVEDVLSFPGHIACDAASRSEIVVPIHGKDGQILGVLDIDSAQEGRFTEEDEKCLVTFAEVLGNGIAMES